MDDDGYIRIAGRSKDIIIRGGKNIPVVEIEGLLYKHPAISQVAIVGYADTRLGERACAFVVPRSGTTVTLADVVDFLLESKLAKQYLPERLEVIAEMPCTPSGKIQKSGCVKSRPLLQSRKTPARRPTDTTSFSCLR